MMRYYGLVSVQFFLRCGLIYKSKVVKVGLGSVSFDCEFVKIASFSFDETLLSGYVVEKNCWK